MEKFLSQVLNKLASPVIVESGEGPHPMIVMSVQRFGSGEGPSDNLAKTIKGFMHNNN